MGRNPHSLAERAAVRPTSIISLKICTINWNVLVTTGYCISRRYSLTGLCIWCPIPPPVPALWTVHSHRWECTVKCLHCPVVSTRSALFWAICFSCSPPEVNLVTKRLRVPVHVLKTTATGWKPNCSLINIIITQRVVVIPYGRLRTTFRSHPQTPQDNLSVPQVVLRPP
jgi:hypothetical protein